MPRSRRSTGKSPAPAAKEDVSTTRKTRGASAPAVETPSPKKSRKRSPSPSPAPRGRSRGRGAKGPDSKQEKGQGDDVEEPSPKKGRVTRAVMQQDETPTRGRASSSRKAAEPKKPAPSPTPKSRSSSRQKAAPTPTKAEEPKAETSRSRSRSKPAKPEPKTPEPKPAKAKSKPKSQTKKTPVKKATPSPRKAPAKPKPSPKPAASRSRSRGKKEEKANDMPSAQIILTKIDSPTKSNTSLAEKEAISPSRSRARSSVKTPPQKVSPKESRRSKSSEKSTPPTRRGRRSAEAKEEVEDAAKEEDTKENEGEENEDKEVAPEKAEAVEESAKPEEASKDEDMDTKDTPLEIEDKVGEKENEVSDEENEKVEESKDEIEEENEIKEKEKVSQEEKKDGEIETADVEETDEKLEEKDQKQEETVEEKMEEEVVNDKEEPCEPEEESPALEPTPPLETSPVKESLPSPIKESSAAEECKPPEIEAISDDEPIEEEAMEEDVVEEQKEEKSKEVEAAPAAEESMAAKAEVPEPVITDGEQQNGSPDDPLSSPTRKRKWDELDDEGEDASPKKVRRSIDMTDVTSEGVVTTNGEDQISKTEEESMETSVDQKVLEPEVAQTSTDTGNHDIEQEYVVVNMDEIPAANSTEVLQCIPTETHTETPKEEAATVLAAEQSQSVAPAEQVVLDVNQEQTTASLSSPTSEFNPVLSRKFIPNPSYHLTGDTNKQFSVVSYNILAQCHLERNDYTFTESQYLAENYRHQNLMKEIEYLAADLVCMQEVGPQYFESMLKPAMTKLGYEGIIKKRTQDYFDEGEATFYRTSRFSVVDTRTYSLADLAEQELEDGGVSEEVKVSIRKYLDLPDVLVLTKLRCNVTGNLLCVGNIHVQWGKMEIPDAQCIQIVCAIKELAKQGGSDCHAQILCGDFNSEVTSPGYKLAMEGYITDEVLKQLQALENLEMPDSSKAALVNHLWRAFQHTSHLKSAYQSAQGCEPSVTSYNRVMLAAVDYIFYCGSNLHNVGVLETANEGHIKATGGIPDRLFPSDHVSIKAVFAFS